MIMDLLREDRVLAHPFVTGELALGHIRREQTLATISELRQAKVAEPSEVLHFIRHHEVRNTGIGYVDVHLLAALKFMPKARLWTRDQRLKRVAEGLSLAAPDLI